MKKIFRVVKLLFSTAAERYPGFFVFETLKTIIQAAQPFLGIIISPLIVDELCEGRNPSTLIKYAAILIGGEYVLGFLNSWVNARLQKYQERLDNYFTVKLGQHAMELDFQLTEDKKALEQIEKAKTGMSWYSGGAYGIAEQIFMFIGNIFKVFGFTVIIAQNAPLTLIVIVVYIAVNAFITSKNNKIEFIAYGRLSKLNRLFSYYGWEIVDFKYGKDVRLYDAKDMLVNRWQRNTDESTKAWKWQADKGLLYGMASDAIGIPATVFTFFYSGYLVIKKVFSIGTYTQIVSAAGALNGTLGGLVWNVQELIKRCNYAYEYVLFMEYPEAITKGNVHVNEGEHTIEFKDVSFAYPGTDKKILDGINLKVEPGEHLSIVGLNGAGKTTLIKLLCRLYDTTEGEILLDGRNIKEYDYKEYMSQFAPVFQDFQLFGFSVEENITAGKYEAVNSNEKVDEIIKLAELEDILKKFPHGKESTIFKYFDEEGVEPSGGEQQKLALARALYKKSPVVILDEPTAALDPIAEYEIYRQFNTLVGNKTAFYISHRLSSCRFCDKIAVFSEGKIKEYGHHDELVKLKGGIYAGMFEAQAQYYR